MTKFNKETILEMAQKYVGMEINQVTVESVEYVEVPKNNGIREGIMIRLSNDIAPTIYTDSVKDEMDFYFTIEQAIDSASQQSVEKITGDISDRTRWRLSAVNYEKCTENGYLKDKAFVKVLDMAFIPTVDFEKGSCKLSEKALEAIDVSISEFVKVATRNTKITIHSLQSVLMDLMKEDGDMLDDEIISEMCIPEDDGLMSVAIDPSGHYGTTIFVNNNLLQKTREKLGDFYIIPSSVHEVLLVKADTTSGEDLRNIIGEVNTNVLAPEDFLSNNAYIYNGELQIAS